MLAEKRFGLFECADVSHHTLMSGVPSHLRIAHSRWNELGEDDLTACNYTVVARSPEAGIDTFVKQRKNSLSVFFQGHPEYDKRALLLEYRRDIGRFLRGERETYPGAPHGYFDAAAAAALASFQERALRARHADLLDGFPISLLESRIVPASRAAAVRMYANWLSYVHARRQQAPSVRLRRRAVHPLRNGAIQSV